MVEAVKSKEHGKRTAPIEVRLLADDLARFDQVCRLENKKRPEIARRAIIWYLDHLDAQADDARESKLEMRLRKLENRMAALISRGNIDTGVILELIYANMPSADKDATFKKCHKRAALRLKSKISEVDDIKELYVKELSKAEGPEG